MLPAPSCSEANPRVQHWREKEYVTGFLKDAHVAAWRIYADLTHAAGMIKTADIFYSKLIVALQMESETSQRAELPLADALWAFARLNRSDPHSAPAHAPSHSAGDACISYMPASSAHVVVAPDDMKSTACRWNLRNR
jgi:hypothetical protein